MGNFSNKPGFQTGQVQGKFFINRLKIMDYLKT